MEEQGMSWDPALLRKFSSTGHFRLLNQLKNDLSKRGLNRDQSTGELKLSGSPSRSGRRGGGSRRSQSGAASAQATPTVTVTPDPDHVEPKPETPGTFRQRLSAIDMR